MTTDPLRLGFIGGGINSAVGDTHFIASQMDGLFKVESGCFSENEEVNRQTSLRRHIDSNRLYSSWQELLSKEATHLDAIVVLTPTPDHTPAVLAAIEVGMPVICEKALAACS